MLDKLNENELEIASKLVFDGLSMAKKSMEQILQSPISIEKIDYSSSVDVPLPKFEDLGGQSVHVIKTKLIGELKGTSHLIFREDEVAKVFKACLPAKLIDSDTPESRMMKIGFLTEIDNMMAAAVITEFSNFLGLEIYGHVPSLNVVKSTEVNSYLEKEAGEFDAIIRFKAIFHGVELDISPDFVWIFQEEFVDKIRDLV
jgi:chemotaxis protein CheY-P-specific phosphatase CheC